MGSNDWLDKYLPMLLTFLGGAISAAWFPALVQAMIARLSGRERAEIESIKSKTATEENVSAASVAQSMINGVKELSDLTAKVLDETVAVYETKLAEADARYKRLEQTSRREAEKARRDQREAVEKIKKQIFIIEQQNTKLKQQLERVRAEAAQLRADAETWRNQIIEEYHGTPKSVPFVSNKEIGK